MPSASPITAWHWLGFVLAILVLVALDLRVFHRFAHVVRMKEALLWSSLWVLLALIFARFLLSWRGREESLQFLTGYLIEFSLSMDNVFAIVMIFSYFGVEAAEQHRVLYWGIIGALVMRGLMIGVGAALILTFHWLLYLLGAFLLLTGIKWGFSKQEMARPEKNGIIRLARRVFPVSAQLDGSKFITIVNGRRVLTPLALVLLTVETTDLLFAIDSIPAIFAVTQNAFIVFTSNIMAVLGLRSLYFVLAGAIRYFRHLRGGLAGVLIFIGAKMLLVRWHPISTSLSLAAVGTILAFSILWSVVTAHREAGD